MTSDYDDSTNKRKENLSASPWSSWSSSSSSSSSACGAPSPNINHPPEAAALATGEENQLRSTDELVSTQSQDNDGQSMNHHDHFGDEHEDETGGNNVVRSCSTDGGIIDRHSDKDVLELIDDALDGLPLSYVLNETTKPRGQVEQIQDNEVPAENLSASLAASLEATNKGTKRRNVGILNDVSVPFDPSQFDVRAMENRGGEHDNIVSSRESIEGDDDVEVGNDLKPGEELVKTHALDPIKTSSDNNDNGFAIGQENIESETRSNNVIDAIATNRESQSAEMHVAHAYAVEGSDQDVVIATHLEPTSPALPWWKQRKTKIFLGTVCLVVTAMAIALGVFMSSSSGGEPLVVVVVRTDTPSKSLVPTSIPSVSLRPSVHPSHPPTTTPSKSPSLARFESLKIVADDGAAYDRFGRSVAAFGDTLVVGAYYDNGNEDDSGSAYIYYRDIQTKEWVLQQKLVAGDGAIDDYFGWSVAIYGDTVVVAALHDNDKGDASGSAYVYHQDPVTQEWIFQQQLVTNDGAASDYVGDSVAIYNNTLIMGASSDDDKGSYSGSAYIYHQDPETEEWILQQKLVADDGAASDEFGGSVAIFGDTVIVGAYGDDDKGSYSGSAYIYHQDPDTKEWILQQKLVADDGAASAEFGGSVAIFGDTVVVGADRDDDKGSASGSAYIYHQDPETKEWIFQQKLVADDGAASDEFGESVAIYGSTLVVGASSDDTDKGVNSGSAYIYHQDPVTKEWMLRQKLVADDGAALDYFGNSVAIYNGTVVVGASSDDDKGDASGSVYVYS